MFKKRLLLLIPTVIAMAGMSACDSLPEIISIIESELNKDSSGEPGDSTGQEPGDSTSVEPGNSGDTSSISSVSSTSSNAPSTSSQEPDNPPTTYKAHPWISENEAVTIRWDNTFSYTSQIETLINDFNKIEPYITVNSNKISGGYDLIESNTITGFAGGDYANIVTCYPDHVANYIDYRKAINFENYIYSEYGYTDEELFDFVESYIEEGMSFFDEGIYVMPQSKSTEVMFYNAKIIGKVIEGVNGGRPISESYINSLNWEELLENFAPKFVEWNNNPANKIVKLDPSEWTKNKFGGILGYDSDANLFITMAKQMGIPYTSFNMKTGYGSVDFDNPEAKALVTKLKRYYDSGYLFTQGTCGSYTNYAFTDNQCLFTIGSTGGLKYQVGDESEVKVAFIPQARNGVEDAVISQGPGVCILDRGNEKENLAAWAFIKFLNEPENTMYWSTETGYAPTRYSVFENDDFIEFCDPESQEGNDGKVRAKVLSLYDQVKDYLFVSPAFKGSSTVRAQVGGLLTNALIDKDGHMTANTYQEWLDSIFADALNTCKKAL